MKLSRRTVTVLTVLLAVILLFLLTIFMRSQQPIEQARKEVIQLVELDYEIEDTQRFYWLTTPDATYFSLEFTTNGEPMYAVVARDGGDTTYYTPADIISNEDAQSILVADLNPHEILQARLGMIENDPVWEVTFKEEDNRLGYYYIDARDGEIVQIIRNF